MKAVNVYTPFIRRFCLLIMVLFTGSLMAQVNLIANPSFESNRGIPYTANQFSLCTNWYTGYGSIEYYSMLSPQNSTPHISCGVYANNNFAGKQLPRTGNFYNGFCLKTVILNPTPGFSFWHYFELFGDSLVSPLLKDHVYDFGLFYSKSEISNYVSSNFSALFTDTVFDIRNFALATQQAWDNEINSIKPQVTNDTNIFLNADTINWHQFSGCFIAKGGEKYVTIGNFKDNNKSKVQFTGTNYISQCVSPSTANMVYLYIDDVSLYDRGYYSGKAKTVRKDTTICFNSPLVIGDNRKDSSQYVWQPATGLSCTNCPNPVANPSVTTKYTLTKTLCSFVTKDSITVTVYTPTATAKAGNDFTLCLGSNQVVSIGTADSTRFSSYNWQPPVLLTCATCATPSIKGIDLPASTVAFTLLRTECGITTTATVNMTLEDCETTYTVPNIYTPNNDNVNDVWGLQFNQIRFVKGFRLNVYNRWGNVIFESTQPNRKWDARTNSGEPVSAGVYFYTVEFLINDKPVTLKGTVTLLR
ncbi:MAG: gliding motility-associated C-terminal domain-containing protein [Sediminibacterium sp.]|nr:gliding motility-associated C-terminal domain-containing protein [Sediminibacterium sp.]